MAIREFSSKGVPRSKVAFFGELPEEEHLRVFTERGFQCGVCTEGELNDPQYRSEIDAIVFSQRKDQRASLTPLLRRVCPALLNHDVRVYVRIAVDPDRTATARRLIVDPLLEEGLPLANLLAHEWSSVPEARREREGSFLAPFVYIFDSAIDWTSIAHTICDHPAGGLTKGSLAIDGVDLQAFANERFEEWRLLLERAFSDCSSLHLQPMADGLSGVPVFKAYATLREGLIGRWPYLHFVKLGARSKIVEEYDRYISRALDYVPFHLGPRLRLDRCNLGATQGVLVGDFVEGAEPIRDAAPAHRAGHAITNLFEKTLAAWRKQAQPDTTPSIAERLAKKWLDERGDEIHLPAGRVQVVQSLGGATMASLRNAFDRLGCGEALYGPAHGDLHATNVLVRGSDAIIIDFEKTEDHYPLLYDPASLEAGLLVDGFAKDPRCPDRVQDLFDSIERLYTYRVLVGRAAVCHAADPSSWFFDCALQIRSLSRHAECEDGQYALVLALCLIRKGCNPHTFDPSRESLRAVAYALGCKVLQELERHAAIPRSATT